MPKKNKIWDKKCTKINIYIGRKRNTKTWKFMKNITGKRQIMPIPTISHSQEIDRPQEFINRKDLNIR